MLTLVTLLAGGSNCRAGEFFSIEIAFTSENFKKREYLASSADQQIKKQLLHSAKMDSIRSASQYCKSLGGTPSRLSCVRDARFEVTHRWGGRIGYSVFLASVETSVKCRLEENRFTWAEKAWYQSLNPLMNPCDTQHRVFSSDGAHYSH